VAVCRHCCGEVYLVIWVEAVAGDRVVAGVEADSAAEASVAVEVLVEDLAEAVISVEADRVAVGRKGLIHRLHRFNFANESV
jgi:hypothetical protein